MPGPGVGVSAPGGGGVCSGRVSAPRGGVPGPGGGRVGIQACTEADTPPPPMWTLVKILPSPNFVAAGKNKNSFI